MKIKENFLLVTVKKDDAMFETNDLCCTQDLDLWRSGCCNQRNRNPFSFKSIEFVLKGLYHVILNHIHV